MSLTSESWSSYTPLLRHHRIARRLVNTGTGLGDMGSLDWKYYLADAAFHSI